MNLKVKVTPEENRRVQEILFKMGYSWGGDSKKVRHVERHVDFSYLFVYDDKYLGCHNCVGSFNSHPHKEVAPSYFEIFETKLWKVLNES